MTQLLRLLRVIIAALFRGRPGAFDGSELAFRVLPTDIDINLHMNNARYLAIMDLGRWDMVLRSGLWRFVLKEKMQPVIGGAVVRFRRPLRPFQRFVLKTRQVTWDERWLYLEQDIESGGQLACQARVRAAFVQGRSLVPPGRVAAMTGAGPTAPPAPRWVQSWREFDEDAAPPRLEEGSVSCAH